MEGEKILKGISLIKLKATSVFKFLRDLFDKIEDENS